MLQLDHHKNPTELLLIDPNALRTRVQSLITGNVPPTVQSLNVSDEQICRTAFEFVVRTHETINPLPLVLIYGALILAGSLVGVALLLQLLNVLSVASAPGLIQP